MNGREALEKLEQATMIAVVSKRQNYEPCDELFAMLKAIRAALAEPAAVPEAREQHCKDCCCAQSWKALGITEYTGLSIPEHIARLRAWEAWGREHAVPALQSGSDHACDDALAASPRQEKP